MKSYQSLLLAAVVCLVSVVTVNAKSWPLEPSTFRKVPLNCKTAELLSALPSIKCTATGTDSLELNCSDTFSIGHVPCKAYYRIHNGRFVWVHGLFSTEDFDVIRAIFTDKFGEPHSTKNEVVTTPEGRDRLNAILTWTGDKVIVILNKCENGLDKGGFSFKIKSYLEERTQIRIKERQNAVDDF